MPPLPILVRPLGKRGRTYQISERVNRFYRLFSLMITTGLVIVGFSVPVCTFVVRDFAAAIYGILGGGVVCLIGMAGTVVVAWIGRSRDQIEKGPDASFTSSNDYRPLYTTASLVTAVILLILSMNAIIWNLIKSQPFNPIILFLLLPSAAVILIRGREWLNRRR